METANDAITNALLQLFNHKQYIPLYPFKTIIQCVLRDEASEVVSQQIIDYASIPSEEMHLQIKIVMFGDSTFVGTKHLVKLVSASSVKELKPVCEHIRSVFGNQVQTYKTERIDASYIDVYLVDSCLSHTLVKPLQHRVDSILEVVIKGKVDECINLFIRRILEDAHISETSHNILTSKLTVTIRETSEDINVYSMRDRRQQVINSLKAAVLDEGDIVLECYIRINKSLLSYDDKCSKSLDSYDGFIRLRRRYKLSCIDESNRDNIVVRCFSHNPLESIVLGVFSSLKDADMYLKCASEHLRRMRPRNAPAGTSKQEEVDLDAVSSDNATLLLNATINTLSTHIVHTLRTGELAACGVSMMVALGLLSCTSSNITYAMQQVRCLTYSSVMHIHAVRDAIQSVCNVMTLLVGVIHQSPSVHAQLRGHALSTAEVEALDKIHAVYNTLSPALKQIKYLLLELLTLNQYSELTYLSPHIMHLLWGLFDPVTKTHTILKTLAKGVSHTVHTMQHCTAILHKLNCALHMVELTIGTEILVSTVKHNLLSYKSYSRNTTTGISSILNLNALNTTTTSTLLHPYTHLPRCMSDLLGYAAERVLYMQNNIKMVHSGDYSELQWRPVVISKYLHVQLLPEDGHKQTNKQKGQANTVTVEHSNIESHIESVQHLWDLYALLGEYNVARLGGIDNRAITQLEWDRYDYPRFMCVEASKLRYLGDIKVLQALQKGLFMALTAPSVCRPLGILSSVLYEYSAKVSLFANVSDSTLADYVMQPARRDRIIPEPTATQHSGLYKLPFCSGDNRLYITGGVLGSDRVLTALGAQAHRVFVNMWNLPPLFHTTPAGKPGIHVKVYSGVALTTAMHWCAPHLHLLRTVQESHTTHDIEDENTIDKSLFPTTQPVEKKGLFGNIRKKKQSLTRTDSTTHTTEEEEVEIIEYAASEDEDEHNNNNADSTNVDHTQNTNNNTNTNNTGTTPSTVDPDSGVLRSRGVVELEVVLKICYDSSALFEQAQAVFGREVGSCVQYLAESPDWKPTRVCVHRDNNTNGPSSASGEMGSVYGTHTNKISIFECAELGDRRSNTSMWSSMEGSVAQYGACIIETGVVCSEVDSALTKAELTSVFEQVVFRGKKSSSTGEGGLSSNKYYTADFNDVKPNSTPRSANITSKRNAGVSNASVGVSAGASAESKKTGPAAPSARNTTANSTNVVVDEDQHSLDPTRSDADRLCRDSHVHTLLHGAATQGSKHRAQCYIPCRIRFTLLTQLSPRMTWGTSAAGAGTGAGGVKGSKFNPVQQAARGTAERYSAITGQQSNPLTIGTDATVARLLASTLWVSPEAARGVWQCAQGGEAQCILYESVQRHVAYHHDLSSGSVCSAYEHVLVNSVLTQNYHITVSVYRALNGVAFKFRRLVNVVELCRHILSTDNTTYNVSVLGVTLARYVCLGYRYLLMSPQVAHLRGGCAYLLQCISRIEAILQLVPITPTECMTKLPSRLSSAESVEEKKTGGAFSALFGAHTTKTNTSSTSANTTTTSNTTPLMVQPDDMHFESALASATNKASQANRAQVRRTVPLDASANASAPLGVGEEGLRRLLPSGGGGSGDGEVYNSNNTINSGEAAFRSAVSNGANVSECIALLHTVEHMSHALLHTLGDDLHANFEHIHDYMSAKHDNTTHTESIPYAMRGLGVQKHSTGGHSTVSGVYSAHSVYKHPSMVASSDCLDMVLGSECSVTALVSFIMRAESPLNAALSQAQFESNIQSVALLRKFKMATLQLLNSAGDTSQRHANLRRVVEVSHALSRQEQVALREVVRGTSLPALHTLLPPVSLNTNITTASSNGTITAVTTNSTGRSRANSTSTTTDTTATMTAIATVDPTGTHKSAAMHRFKAGAEIIRMMAQADLGGLPTHDSSAPTGNVVNNASIEDRARLQSVVHSLTRGRGGKGVAGLFKKLQVSLSHSSSAEGLPAGPEKITTGGNANNGGDGGRRASEDILSTDTSAAFIHNINTTTDSAGTPDKEKNDIQSMIDMMFQKSDSNPHTSLHLNSSGSGALNTYPDKGITNHNNSTVQAEAEAFYRAPVSAPLSRFHDEKVKQRRKSDGFFQLGGVSSDSNDVTHNSTGGVFAKHKGDFNRGMSVGTESTSDSEGEEIMLSHMHPSTHSTHIRHTRSGRHTRAHQAVHTSAPQSTGVRVFDSAVHKTEHVSMLDLLRQSMAEQDINIVPHVTNQPRSLYYNTTSKEDAVESGGMLHSLRGRPKPDHQQPRDVYF